MKKTLLALAVSSAVVAAPAYAVEAEISGQINRAMINHNNGEQSATTFVDNTNSGSRIRITGSETLETNSGSEIEYGLKWEWQHQSNASQTMQAGQFDDNNRTSDINTLDIRQQVVYVKGNAGKLSLGQTNGAADGTAETDLSGTSVVAYSDAAGDLLGGIGYANKTGNTVNQVTTVAAQTGQYDGLSRHDVIRYDSPNLGPVVVSASMGNGSSSEFAVRYAAELGEGNKLAASLGWADVGNSLDTVGADGLYNTSDDGKTNRTRTAFSLSYLASFGLNLTLSYSMQDTTKFQGTKVTSATGVVTDGAVTNGLVNAIEGKNPTFTYFKVGYNFGQHAVSLDYAIKDNDMKSVVNSTGNVRRYGDARSMALAYVYKPASSIDLYASYRNESIDNPKTVNAAGVVTATTSVKNINAMILGSRIKF